MYYSADDLMAELDRQPRTQKNVGREVEPEQVHIYSFYHEPEPELESEPEIDLDPCAYLPYVPTVPEKTSYTDEEALAVVLKEDATAEDFWSNMTQKQKLEDLAHVLKCRPDHLSLVGVKPELPLRSSQLTS